MAKASRKVSSKKKKTEKKAKTPSSKVKAKKKVQKKAEKLGKKKAPARAKEAVKGKKKAATPQVQKMKAALSTPPPVTALSDAERKEKLRRLLLSLREKILSEAKTEIAKYMKGETKQIVETALDDGDWSVVDLAEDISLRQLSSHRENLIKVDEALRKLDEGTYGICEECGEEITEERLKILPFAIYCRECQERKEIMEKIEREYE